MKKIIFSALILLISITTFSQVVNTQFTDYCHDDNVELVLSYSQSFNSINWQLNDGEDWFTISASSVYSGVNNDTLFIQGVDNSFNMYQYRAIIDTGLVGGFVDTSNVYGFSVYDDFMLGSLSGDETICFNTLPTALTSPIATGGEGVYSYQWFKDGSIINGATSPTYQPTALTSTAIYSVEVSDLCGTLHSNDVEVTVLSDLLIGSLVGFQTLCFGDTPSLLASPLVSGGAQNYSYQWYKDGILINGATGSTYQSGSLFTTSQFSLEVTDDCGQLQTNSITISVYADMYSGQITGAQTICYNTVPSALNFSTPSEGGQGVHSYQWQSSTDGSNWINEIGAVNTSFSPSSLLETTHYRVNVMDSCETIFTNEITISVYDEFMLGSLSGDETICFNTLPTALTSPIATGGEGVYSYQWFKDGSIINGATSPTYQPTALTSTAIYSVEVSDLCGTLHSNDVEVTVLSDLLIGSLVGFQTLCFGDTPSLLASPLVSGGAQNYSYQWYKDGILINGATSPTYQPTALTSTAIYSVEVSDLCGTLHSNDIVITVLDDLLPGSVVGDTVICYNTNPYFISIAEYPSGGSNTSYLYQWQSSVDGSEWFNLNGANNETLFTGLLTSSTYYRLEVYSGVFNCGPKYTNSVFVEVQDPFIPGILANQNICFNTSTEITHQQLPTGGFETYNYQWQISNDQVNWVNIGSDQDSHLTSNHSSDVYYQVIVSDVCGQLTSNTSLIHVYDSLQAGAILSNDTICYNTFLNPVDANNELPLGGDLTYTYDWYFSNDGVNFNFHPSSNSILDIGFLQDTTFIYVDYVSGNNCGTVSSNVLEVIVFPEVNPGSVLGDTSICYNTAPGILNIDELPSGGDELYYSYQWQESIDNQTWTNIISANSTTYQPSSLTSSVFYRLEIHSGELDCGPKHTNSVFVEVFDMFESGSLASQPAICFNTLPNVLSFDNLPNGADGEFTYSWELNNGGNWIQLNEFSTSYQPNSLISSTEYRVLVTSIYGCGSAYNQTLISVYDSLVPGEIQGADVICYNEIPDLLSLSVDATGGGDGYFYSWSESDDQQNWVSSGVNNTSYQPQSLFDTTYYILEFASNENCGSVLSNIVEVIVNPLPDTVDIVGPSIVCGNSIDVEYTMSNISNVNSYSWNFNAGSFIGSSEDDYILVHFDDFPQNDVLYLEQTVSATGCSNIMEFAVEISSELAPDQGVVIQKQNTNILITSDSTLGINYEWGFVEIATGVETILSDTNRYALMPHIDTETYWYWVDTYFDNTCITRSYFNGPPIPTDLLDEELNVRLYPNPSNGWLFVDSEQFTKAGVYSVHGQLLFETFSNNIDLNYLDNGVYIVKVYLENRVLTSKILKK